MQSLYELVEGQIFKKVKFRIYQNTLLQHTLVLLTEFLMVNFDFWAIKNMQMPLHFAGWIFKRMLWFMYHNF